MPNPNPTKVFLGTLFALSLVSLQSFALSLQRPPSYTLKDQDNDAQAVNDFETQKYKSERERNKQDWHFFEFLRREKQSKSVKKSKKTESALSINSN